MTDYAPLPVRGNTLDLEKYGLRPEFPEVLDSSMVKDFMYCPSYFYLRHVLGLKKKYRVPQEDAGMDWGTKWHDLMYAWHLTYDMTEALKSLEPWPESVMAETDRHGRSKERMIKIFFDYVDKFGESDRKNFEVIRLENFFDIFDEEFEIRWCGRMDRVVRRRTNGRIMLWDYKTTSYMIKFYFEQFEHSFQMPGYARMLSQLLTEPVREVYLDVVHTLKKDHDFYRRSIPYSPAKIAEWGRNVRNVLDWMYWLRDNHLYNPEAWIKNWNHCTSWNKACQFADVHWSPPTKDTRLRILRDNYEVERWDPIEALEEERST